MRISRGRPYERSPSFLRFCDNPSVGLPYSMGICRVCPIAPRQTFRNHSIANLVSNGSIIPLLQSNIQPLRRDTDAEARDRHTRYISEATVGGRDDRWAVAWPSVGLGASSRIDFSCQAVSLVSLKITMSNGAHGILCGTSKVI